MPTPHTSTAVGPTSARRTITIEDIRVGGLYEHRVTTEESHLRTNQVTAKETREIILVAGASLCRQRHRRPRETHINKTPWTKIVCTSVWCLSARTDKSNHRRNTNTQWLRVFFFPLFIIPRPSVGLHRSFARFPSKSNDEKNCAHIQTSTLLLPKQSTTDVVEHAEGLNGRICTRHSPAKRCVWEATKCACT